MKIITSPITPAMTNWTALVPPVAELPAPGFLTCRQIAEQITRSIPQTNKIINAQLRAGRAEMKLFRPPAAKYPIPHYRLIPQTHEKTTRKNPPHRRHR